MCAVPNMVVFCSWLISCISGTLRRYFLNDFEMVPVAPFIIGMTFVFTLHMPIISVVRSVHCRILSTSFFITFLPSENACSVFIKTDYDVRFIVGDGSVGYLLLLLLLFYLIFVKFFVLKCVSAYVC